MSQESWKEKCTVVDNETVFKTNMITITLDSSENHLASKVLMDLVDAEMRNPKRFFGNYTSI